MARGDAARGAPAPGGGSARRRGAGDERAGAGADHRGRVRARGRAGAPRGLQLGVHGHGRRARRVPVQQDPSGPVRGTDPVHRPVVAGSADRRAALLRCALAGRGHAGHGGRGRELRHPDLLRVRVRLACAAVPPRRDRLPCQHDQRRVVRARDVVRPHDGAVAAPRAPRDARDRAAGGRGPGGQHGDLDVRRPAGPDVRADAAVRARGPCRDGVHDGRRDAVRALGGLAGEQRGPARGGARDGGVAGEA